jgi:hypothetical protein
VAIDYLNKNSKDYRNVSYILKKEKIELKRGYRESPSTPINIASNVTSIINVTGTGGAAATITAVNDEPQPDYRLEILNADKEVDRAMDGQPRFKKFLSTIFYFFLSQSEIFCYFFMILNHLNSASALSVVFPISVFLWAMLCMPRPTKTFWIACITYIEFVVVLKYLFQFKVFEWNKGGTTVNNEYENTKKWLTILGLEKKDNFAIYDLFALLVIFLHRCALIILKFLHSVKLGPTVFSLLFLRMKIFGVLFKYFFEYMISNSLIFSDHNAQKPYTTARILTLNR